MTDQSTQNTSQEIPFPGFKKLFIRDVPHGGIISSDTVGKFPLKDSGSYISEDKQLMIQEEPNDEFRLIAATQDAVFRFHSKFAMILGDESYINNKVKEFYADGKE